MTDPTPEAQQAIIRETVQAIFDSNGGVLPPAPPAEPPAPEPVSIARTDAQRAVQILIDHHGLTETNALRLVASGEIPADVMTSINEQIIATKENEQRRAEAAALARIQNSPEARMRDALANERALETRERIVELAYKTLAYNAGVSVEDIAASVKPDDAVRMSGIAGVEDDSWTDLDKANTTAGLSPDDLALAKMPLGYEVRDQGGTRQPHKSPGPGRW